MANAPIIDGNGNPAFMKATGEGSDVDPFVVEQNVNIQNTVDANVINSTDIPVVDSSQAKDQDQRVLIYKSLFSSSVTQDATTRNQNVNGSITPVRFFIGPPAGEIWQLTRFIFIIRDTGAFDSGGWGNNGGAPLANGMTVGADFGSTELVFTPIPWTSHADLAGVAYDVTHHSWGSGDEFVVMRLTMQKAGSNLRLVGDDGDNFWMQVNDDLSYLVEQRCMVQGFVEGKNWGDLK